MKASLEQWHFPDAAGRITEDIIGHLGLPGKRRTPEFTFQRQKITDTENS
jgi:hypothetical protein